jgi:hypothetical protein
VDDQCADTGRVGTNDVLERITATMTELGQATAGDIAKHAGMPYSSTTPKLRSLEQQGTAQRVKVDGRTLWLLTVAGPAQDTAGPDGADNPDPDPDADPELEPEPEPDEIGPDDAVAPSPAEDSGDAVTTVEAVADGEHRDAADALPPSASPGPATDPQAVEQPPTGAATTPAAAADAATAGEPVPAPAAPDEPQPAEQDTPQQAGKRPKGALQAAALKVLQDQPDRQFKVGEVCKLINQADAGKGWSKASPGAVVNDLNKLAGQNKAQRTVDQPATYQAV